MDFQLLFSPIRIGTMEVGNRFVVPPMGTNLANPDGTVSEDLIAYWEARAKGGWGPVSYTHLSCRLLRHQFFL